MQAPKCQEKNHFQRDITLFCLQSGCQQKWGCQKCLSQYHKNHIDNCISVNEFEDSVIAAKRRIREIVDMKFSEAILLLDEASKQLLKKIKDVINTVQKAQDIIQDQIFKDLEIFDYLIEGFKNQTYTETLTNDYLERIVHLIEPQQLQQISEHKQCQINQLIEYSQSVLEQVNKLQIFPLDEIAIGIKLKEFQEGFYTLAVKEYNSNNIGNCYLVNNGRLNRIGQYDNGLRSGIWSEVLYYNQYRDYSITFKGCYNHGQRVNDWYYYDFDQSIIGGGHFFEGQKIGYWVEPEVFLGKWGKMQLSHIKVNIIMELKMGNGQHFMVIKVKCGGYYNSGQKHGLWTETEAYAGFWCSIGIQYKGEYINGVKQGLWIISELNTGQIGGGQYNQIGLKEGLWTEIEVHVGVGCSVILLNIGDYKNGQRIGFWKILDLCRNQVGGGEYKNYKKGLWIEAEVCVGWRCSQILLHKGKYKKGKRVGLWNIYKEGSETVIGGGNYVQGQKDNKWTDVQVYSGYFSTKILIYTGDYNQGIKIGKWVISEQSEGVIGGGTYSKNGEKESEWIDVDMQVGWRCYVIVLSEGEYHNGKRQGLWITKIFNGNQLGGGCYNKYGYKEGGWKEVEIHPGVGKYLTLYHIGEYRAGIRVGTWAIQNENRGIVSSGFYTKSGNKEGEWIEIQVHEGIEDQIVLFHQGEYNHGVRVGKWNIQTADKTLIGGGCYTMSGLKEGLWQDIKCHMGYKTEVILQYTGQYEIGIRKGKWNITNIKNELIGGGSYLRGIKTGKWIDVEVRVGGGCQIIIKNEGEYDNGIRIGEWIITYHGSNTITGGGTYNNRGYKIDKWTEIVPHIGYCNLIILQYVGCYKNNTRIGEWIIQNSQKIGGGEYQINGMKNGKWTEIFQQYFDSLTIMSGEYQNGHKLQNWEYIDKLLKDL